MTSKRGGRKASSLLSRVYFNAFYEERLLLVKITVNLRGLMPDEDTASSTPQPAYKTGITISLLFVRHIFKLLYEVSYDERRNMDDTTKNALVGGMVGGIAWLVVRHFWEKHKFKKELHESLEELKYQLKYNYRY